MEIGDVIGGGRPAWRAWLLSAGAGACLLFDPSGWRAGRVGTSRRGLRRLMKIRQRYWRFPATLTTKHGAASNGFRGQSPNPLWYLCHCVFLSRQGFVETSLCHLIADVVSH